MIKLSILLTADQHKKIETLKNWRAPFMTVAEFGQFLLLVGLEQCQECPEGQQQPRQGGINLKKLTD